MKMLFFNAALIILILQVFVKKNVIDKGGLIYIEYYLFLTNAIVGPALWTFHPWLQ